MTPEQIASLPAEAREAVDDPARRLRHYLLISSVGSGAMGEVWKAWDTHLRRWVAVKVLRVANEEAVHRFEREARLAARLQHPNIVPVHEVDVESGRPFLVLEFVAGHSLEGMKRESRRAAEIVRDVACAVHYAHQQGIVHRDLKPANILESAGGRVLVTDFGLAKELDSTSLTQSAAILGTPMYMNPEQVLGRSAHADARTDVYALGAVLYELATGSPPFPRPSIQAIFQAILSEEPIAPRKRNPILPEDLQTICLKAMEKEPSKRYSSAGEFADDLDRFLRGDPILARPIGIAGRWSRRARRNPVAALAIGLLLVSTGATVGMVAGKTLHRRIERRRALDGARGALDRHAWEEALEHAERGSRVAPGELEWVQLQRRAQAGILAHTAWNTLDEVRKLRTDCEGAGNDLVLLRAKCEYAPPSQKGLLWEKEDDLERRRALLLQKTAELEEAAQQALRLDEGNTEAGPLLAELYLERATAARSEGRRAEAEVFRQRATQYGGLPIRERLEKPATLAIETEARVYLFRYVERAGRLIPIPFRSEMGEEGTLEPVSVDPLPPDASPEKINTARDGTAYPLVASDFNAVTFPRRIPAGSYLLLFRQSGRFDVRLLLSPDAGDEVRRRVLLPRLEDVPPGFLPVGDLFVSRWEVSCDEYMEFINDRSVHTTDEAELRLPRTGLKDGFFGHKEGIDQDQFFLPYPFNEDAVAVIGVSYEDATEYAAWRSKRESKWTFRLPTVEEWESAAGASDGRTYPWGDHFDSGFCAMRDSRVVLAPEAGGLFPADESPFGIRDMAGGVREWTSTPTGRGGLLRALRGGALGGDTTFCRIRYGGNIADPRGVLRTIGFRLVAVSKPP